MRLFYLGIELCIILNCFAQGSDSSCFYDSRVFTESSKFTQSLAKLKQKAMLLHDNVKQEKGGRKVLIQTEKNAIASEVNVLLTEWRTLLEQVKEQKFVLKDKDDKKVAKKLFISVIDELSFASQGRPSAVYNLNVFNFCKLRKEIDSVKKLY